MKKGLGYIFIILSIILPLVLLCLIPVKAEGITDSIATSDSIKAGVATLFEEDDIVVTNDEEKSI